MKKLTKTQIANTVIAKLEDAIIDLAAQSNRDTKEYYLRKATVLCDVLFDGVCDWDDVLSALRTIWKCNTEANVLYWSTSRGYDSAKVIRVIECDLKLNKLGHIFKALEGYGMFETRLASEQAA